MITGRNGRDALLPLCIPVFMRHCCVPIRPATHFVAVIVVMTLPHNAKGGSDVKKALRWLALWQQCTVNTKQPRGNMEADLGQFIHFQTKQNGQSVKAALV